MFLLTAEGVFLLILTSSNGSTRHVSNVVEAYSFPLFPKRSIDRVLVNSVTGEWVMYNEKQCNGIKSLLRVAIIHHLL